MTQDQTPGIVIAKNGPYVVTGASPLTVLAIDTNDDGEATEWTEVGRIETPAVYALCRCGGTKNPPFCDGTHVTAGFDGTETAETGLYDQQKASLSGPRFTLEDVPSLCAGARFCDAGAGAWDLASEADSDATADLLTGQVGRCPSGRLVLRNNATGESLEPEFEPSIALVEDPSEQCSGPIWVQGGIPIQASNGTTYEVRNRVALCRCGQSANKPYCDGAHAASRFNDGLVGA